MNKMVNREQELLHVCHFLMSKASISPCDMGCQDEIIQYLEPLGFTIERMDFKDTRNLWATIGKGENVFCFAGHTDVVPPGDVKAWHSDPFIPTIKNGILYGRGAADMKGALAAMLIAVKSFLQQNNTLSKKIAFLITSDEEGDFIHGTVKVIETLIKRKQRIDWCIVGEPSSQFKVGDEIKIGRRGSLSAHVEIIGKQGHVAYQDLAKNPIFLIAPVIHELSTMQWGEAHPFFQQTGFQISNIHAGFGATNVIPGHLFFDCNFRYNITINEKELRQQFETVLHKHGIEYKVSWSLNGEPFFTEQTQLVDVVKSSIRDIMKIETMATTNGGTSDARFIKDIGAQIVELGVSNQTIHQVNESVKIEDLLYLSYLYEDILKKICH